MGKHGPCYHCGVTSTPLWRNGPPEKPVLCNACGSRWRTKGTLENYAPLHSRAEADEMEDYGVSKVKTLPIKNKEAKVLKRKKIGSITEFGGVPPAHSQGFRRGLDEDTSNRSSSGSAISNTESCAYNGSADASDLTGPSQPVVWDSMVPSRKRTCFPRSKPSPVEKLTKDLYTIWHEQQSSCLSASSEEDLLLESDKPMVSVEIGHGSVLIRHPNSIAREEESEASSLSIDNKRHAFSSHLVAYPALIEDTGALRTQNPVYEERSRRDMDQPEKPQILAHHDSPLCHIDLEEIVNLNKFLSHLTNDEQQQLLKLLPPIDTLESPDRNSYLIASLRSMFGSPQFKENLLSFQKILADGVFDNSSTSLKTEDCRVMRKLILSNLTKSKRVEQYKILKDSKGKSVIDESEAVKSNAFATFDSSLSVISSRDRVHQKFPGSNEMMECPKSIVTGLSHNEEIKIDKGCSFFSPKNLFCSDFGDDSCDQDLLLDVPSNSSFPQAELLSSFSFGAQASTTSSNSVYPYLVHP